MRLPVVGPPGCPAEVLELATQLADAVEIALEADPENAAVRDRFEAAHSALAETGWQLDGPPWQVRCPKVRYENDVRPYSMSTRPCP